MADEVDKAEIIAPESAPVSVFNRLPDSSIDTERERVGAGQRAVNLIWEHTQRLIALSVVWVALMVSGAMAVFAKTESVQTASLVFLFGVANLVIGFYFGRTNHQRIGGVGPEQVGR